VRDNFKVNLVAQPPWTVEAIGDAIASGVDYVDFRVKSNYPSMLNLRRVTIDRFKNKCDYIMLLDDDAQFDVCSENYYEKIIEKLDEDRPSVLSTFKNRYPAEFVHNPKNCIMTVNRGLFVKASEFDLFNPPWEIYGGCEDAIIGYHALSSNYNHIMIGGAPVTNYDVKHLSYNSDSFIHNANVYEDNARKYIRRRYGDSNWEVLSGNFPKALRESL